MHRTTELGELIQEHLTQAIDALDLARTEPVDGVATAHAAIESARAVVRLLEAGSTELRPLNDRLNETKATLSALRDSNIAMPASPPLNPSDITTIETARVEVAAVAAALCAEIKLVDLTELELVDASGSSYRQARRRFLQTLPVNEDDPFDKAMLERVAKATRRVYVQLDVILRGEHTIRTSRFGHLADLFDQHHQATLLGTSEAKQIERLETEITRVGLDVFSRKPSAYREWLGGKLTEEI